VYDRTALRGLKGTATFYLEICSNLRDHRTREVRMLAAVGVKTVKTLTMWI